MITRPTPDELAVAHRTIAREWLAGATGPLTPANVRAYLDDYSSIIVDCVAVAAGWLLDPRPVNPFTNAQDT